MGPLLSDDIKEYIEENFNLYLPNQKLQELILTTYPIPGHSTLSIKKMDPLVISILQKDNAGLLNKNTDKAFNSIQNRLFITMGPLGHLWLTLEKIKNRVETTSDDSVHIDNIDIRSLQLIELVKKQFVVWVKQMLQ